MSHMGVRNASLEDPGTKMVNTSERSLPKSEATGPTSLQPDIGQNGGPVSFGLWQKRRARALRRNRDRLGL